MTNRNLEMAVGKHEKAHPAFSHELRFALRYVQEDASSSLTKSRIVLEKLLIDVFHVEMGQPPRKALLGDMLGDNQFTRKLERRILARMNSVRDMGNLGPHGESVEPNDAARVLEDLCEILEWYSRRYSRGMPEPSEPPPLDDVDPLPEELLRALLRSTRVAEAPPDLEKAIQNDLASVGRKLLEVEAAARPGLTMDHVLDVVHEAIGHGAGIYNHSAAGRVGCGRIYHRAAVGLTALAPPSRGTLPQGAALGIDLLARIVKAEPTVNPDTADDLAWELRFVFDSLPLITPVFDPTTQVVLAAADASALCGLLRSVIEVGRELPQAHATAHFLQHVARVLLHPQVADRLLGRGGQPLRQLLEEEPRITRESTPRVVQRLQRCFVQICQNVEGGQIDPQQGAAGRWWWPFSK